MVEPCGTLVVEAPWVVPQDARVSTMTTRANHTVPRRQVTRSTSNTSFLIIKTLDGVERLQGYRIWLSLNASTVNRLRHWHRSAVATVALRSLSLLVLKVAVPLRPIRLFWRIASSIMPPRVKIGLVLGRIPTHSTSLMLSVVLLKRSTTVMVFSWTISLSKRTETAKVSKSAEIPAKMIRESARECGAAARATKMIANAAKGERSPYCSGRVPYDQSFGGWRH